jgi:2-polyprenyl-3-methyl-5-hydroxy-6-metoxy-1,4-benzoquinol methylase
MNGGGYLMTVNHGNWLLGDQLEPDTQDFGGKRAFNDHKIAFLLEHTRGAKVLDIGCVQHNPENYNSRFWVHGALAETASQLVGIDLYEPGVEFLVTKGYDVRVADATNFALGETFDFIVAGDVIEHLGNADGFFESCLAHIRPGGALLISTPNPWHWRLVANAAVRGRVVCNVEHTCWYCPATLGQIAARHGLRVDSVRFGSRYLKDRAMPLPKWLRHTSFHAVLKRETA